MAVDPKTLTDPEKVRSLMANARARGREDLAWACLERIAELAGHDFDEGVERDFMIAVAAAEEIATIKNGKTTRLSRTRQKLKRVGALRTVRDLAINPRTSDGFGLLVENDRAFLTAEAIVLKHRDLFSNEEIEASERKLKDAGIDIDALAREA